MSDEKELEQQGEIAADFIEEFLDVADLDGDLDIEFKKERVYISVQSEGDSNLSKISDPDTVEAVQELARLAVQAKTGEMSRLILDIAGSRQVKMDKLKALVERTIEKLEDTGEAQHLKPMTSYDSKQVHDMVSEAGFVSESEGQGRDRHIVVRKA
jgi:spoIIIJ-associated protein